ncbi:MAG: hypothetical protein SGJ20_01210 [Planctomycetota bacterium]|nr:hypothetical protein [Planctomycetota bacterium]
MVNPWEKVGKALDWRIAGIFCLFMLGGCDSKPERFAATGDVSLDGKPLDQAVISFVPMGGKGRRTGAEIKQGKFEIAAEDGLIPGEYRVEIEPYIAPQFGGHPPVASKVAKTPPSKAPVIPSSYNKQSSLRVQAIAEPNSFSFSLSTTAEK